MFETILSTEVAVALLLLVTWWIAGYLVGRLAFRRTGGRLRFTAWSGLVVLGLAGSLVVARVATTQQLWSFGWLFAQDRVTLALPLLLLPAGAVVLFSVPRLWRLARSPVEDRRAKVDAAGRSAASDPLLVVPVQATAIGATLGAYLAFFPPGPPSTGMGLALWTPLIVATAALWVRQRRRCRELSRPEARMGPGLGVRLLWAIAGVLVLSVGLTAWFVWSTQASTLPDRFSMMAHEADYGGGPEVGHGTGTGHARGGNHAGHGDDGQAVSVTELTGPHTGDPDRRFTLTAQESQIQLSSGETVDAWTFDGQSPGPDLRVRQGDLVEVTLVNELSEAGVTIHWHGIDVPNAEDGVAGVTQDAVQPGETYTYRFRADQVGTYWYHSHQASSEQVEKGLFGAFVVEPREPEPEGLKDITVTAHTWETSDGPVAAIGSSDTLEGRAVAPGTPVRLRLLNTDNFPIKFDLAGTAFRVAAIDGTDVNAPTDLTGQTVKVPAGGRYDLTFTMPETPVELSLDYGEFGGKARAGMLLSHDGKGEAPAAGNDSEFDPTTYGSPEPAPFGPSSSFDREFVQVFDSRPGFYDEQFNILWTINGEVFPDTPMLMVQEGDLVKTTFVNRSPLDHSMHLHGHHMLVLSRNGEPATGSPWWTDTLNVAPGESYEVAFKADNPGVWMDHCHNLDHATVGMMLHLSYEGVTTPFEVGDATDNHPE